MRPPGNVPAVLAGKGEQGGRPPCATIPSLLSPAPRAPATPSPEPWREPVTSTTSRAGLSPWGSHMWTCSRTTHGCQKVPAPPLQPLISLFGGSCPSQASAPNPVWNLKPPKSPPGLAAASAIPLEVLCQGEGSQTMPPALRGGKPHPWRSQKSTKCGKEKPWTSPDTQ